MLKSKIERFVAKKAIICFILLSIINIVAIERKWLVCIGLFVGTIISVGKFGSYAWIFSRICDVGTAEPSGKQRNGGFALVYVLNQVILLLLLFVFYFVNRPVFTGFVAGILTVPFVIMINSVTEALGMTNNHFE